MGKEKGPSERRIVHALLLSESSWEGSSVASDDIENNRVSLHTNTHTQYFAPFLMIPIFLCERKKKSHNHKHTRVDWRLQQQHRQVWTFWHAATMRAYPLRSSPGIDDFSRGDCQVFSRELAEVEQASRGTERRVFDPIDCYILALI